MIAHGEHPLHVCGVDVLVGEDEEEGLGHDDKVPPPAFRHGEQG